MNPDFDLAAGSDPRVRAMDRQLSIMREELLRAIASVNSMRLALYTGNAENGMIATQRYGEHLTAILDATRNAAAIYAQPQQGGLIH